MTDKKLTPLTPEEQKIFESRRETDQVVQNKCPGCGAWYETPKSNRAITESFMCDCGEHLKFKVPAMPGAIIKPTNEELLSLSGLNATLDTGMNAQEAAKRAEHWWETKGRRMMKLELARQSEAVGGSNNGAGTPFASAQADDANFLPSGIIHGNPWSQLNKREMIMVIKAWHHFNIRKPDLLDESQATHKMQDRGRVQ